MSEEKQIILDVIPVYVNEMYPTKEGIWHFKDENPANINKETVIELMLAEIKHKFSDCNAVIILEKGKVIEVL